MLRVKHMYKCFKNARYFEAIFKKPMEEPIYSESEAKICRDWRVHFTNMFMRNYPDRITAKRMHEEKRMSLLKSTELRNFA